MKLYLFLLPLLLVHAQSADNTITLFGTLHNADKLLYNTQVQKPPKSRRGYISYDFNFETFGSRNTTIHAVKVVAKEEGDGATVTLTHGGPGYKSVDLHFENRSFFFMCVNEGQR
ncbi:hypothetical protein K501DRAFT_267896 [Backusella circina FSU 941]|nr:hypothetical protein K501DRAFT_281142 [Backusella circina FSU 941]KAI8888543.1 hypothetical protein K501DRAFT_267896 [Backusella circina FSU 941]